MENRAKMKVPGFAIITRITFLKKKCNEAQWRYIPDLAQDLIYNNPTLFWKIVKSKCKGTN